MNRIDELRATANRNTFQAPADGLIREDRLQKFLGVRKRVYAVYEKHQTEFEALSKKNNGDVSDVTRAYAILTELRTAHAEAQADAGMSEDEYTFLVAQVYKTTWAAEMAPPSGGQQGGSSRRRGRWRRRPADGGGTGRGDAEAGRRAAAADP